MENKIIIGMNTDRKVDEMKKKIICLTVLLLLTGCSNESESLVNTTSIETEMETTQKEISNEILDIEDIDWSISNVVIWDEPTLSFDYTNNSPYTILNVEMKFKLKEGITEEQLEPYNTEYLTMEYILGYNRKLAKSGDTVKFSPCCVNGTYTLVENNDQFDLTEPDNVMIAYVNSNNKIQAIYYDYASGITSDYGEKGDVFEWSDNELASYIKKPDAEVVQIKYDNETDFSIVIHGGNLELASSYAEQFINDGFEGRYYQDRTEYSGVNSENIKVRVVFDDIENTVACSVGKLSETEQSINAQIEPEITQEDVEEIRPEFKKAVDDMEKMYDDIIMRTKEYAESGDILGIQTMQVEFIEALAMIEGWENTLYDQDMSVHEALYYAEATLRIQEKMLEFQAFLKMS